ncbi:anaerobic ribonucleoside-triphosphate reductase activating protein [Colwellia sp. MEBiC06753]
MFNAFSPTIVFQEVPDEISLAFTISGCPLRCSGCHSADTWDSRRGTPLTNQHFSETLQHYQGLITCVLFFGGEWRSQALIDKLIIAHQYQLKTCLYTGLERLPKHILTHLDYVKLGPWRKDCGGLSDINTNQRFYDLNNQRCLNHRFQTP